MPYDPTNGLHVRALELLQREHDAHPAATPLEHFEVVEGELEAEVETALPHLDAQAVSRLTTEIVELAFDEGGFDV